MRQELWSVFQSCKVNQQTLQTDTETAVCWCNSWTVTKLQCCMIAWYTLEHCWQWQQRSNYWRTYLGKIYQSHQLMPSHSPSVPSDTLLRMPHQESKWFPWRGPTKNKHYYKMYYKCTNRSKNKQLEQWNQFPLFKICVQCERI